MTAMSLYGLQLTFWDAVPLQQHPQTVTGCVTSFSLVLDVNFEFMSQQKCMDAALVRSKQYPTQASLMLRDHQPEETKHCRVIKTGGTCGPEEILLTNKLRSFDIKKICLIF